MQFNIYLLSSVQIRWKILLTWKVHADLKFRTGLKSPTETKGGLSFKSPFSCEHCKGLDHTLRSAWDSNRPENTHVKDLQGLLQTLCRICNSLAGHKHSMARLSNSDVVSGTTSGPTRLCCDNLVVPCRAFLNYAVPRYQQGEKNEFTSDVVQMPCQSKISLHGTALAHGLEQD